MDVDWRWKLRHTVEQLKTRYQSIGRRTGYPFLAVVYPHAVEKDFFREWQTLCAALADEFVLREIDLLAVTREVVAREGVDAIVGEIKDPSFPGSSPEEALGIEWVNASVDAVTRALRAPVPAGKRLVVVLSRLAALYPAASPRGVMHALWNRPDANLEVPVVLFIPGRVVRNRQFEFMGKVPEFMYRGDIV